MKKVIILALAGALLAPSFLDAAEQATRIHDARLTAGERADALALLEATAAETLAQVAGLSDAAWSYKPASDKWSVAEVVEHLLLAEGTFKIQIETILETDPNPQWAEQSAGRLVSLRTTVLDRGNKFPANDRVKPSGEIGRGELIERFREARSRTIAFVRTNQKPIKAHTSESTIFNTMNTYHWLMLVGLHNQRHNAQIADILADPGLPR